MPPAGRTERFSTLVTITASAKGTAPSSTSDKPGLTFSRKSNLPTEGLRRSASISRVRNPCCARVAAKLELLKVFPSPGMALVMRKTWFLSRPEIMAKVARMVRKASATKLRRSTTTARFKPAPPFGGSFLMKGMAATTPRPTRFSTWSMVRSEGSRELRPTAPATPAASPPRTPRRMYLNVWLGTGPAPMARS